MRGCDLACGAGRYLLRTAFNFAQRELPRRHCKTMALHRNARSLVLPMSLLYLARRDLTLTMRALLQVHLPLCLIGCHRRRPKGLLARGRLRPAARSLLSWSLTSRLIRLWPKSCRYCCVAPLKRRHGVNRGFWAVRSRVLERFCTDSGSCATGGISIMRTLVVRWDASAGHTCMMQEAPGAYRAVVNGMSRLHCSDLPIWDRIFGGRDTPGLRHHIGILRASRGAGGLRVFKPALTSYATNSLNTSMLLRSRPQSC